MKKDFWNMLNIEVYDIYTIEETIPTWLAWVCKTCVLISGFTIAFLLFKVIMPYVM